MTRAILATVSHEAHPHERHPRHGAALLRQGERAGTTGLRPGHRELRACCFGLLNDILDFSKIEAGKLRLNPARLEVAGVLQEVMSLFASLPGARGWCSACSGRAGGRRLRGRSSAAGADAGQSGGQRRQKFTDAGSVRVEAFQVEAHGDEATLGSRVTDTGIGCRRTSST